MDPVKSNWISYVIVVELPVSAVKLFEVIKTHCQTALQRIV
jgi:hypothetical protein